MINGKNRCFISVTLVNFQSNFLAISKVLLVVKCLSSKMLLRRNVCECQLPCVTFHKSRHLSAVFWDLFAVVVKGRPCKGPRGSHCSIYICSLSHSRPLTTKSYNRFDTHLCPLIGVMNDESKCHTPFCRKDCTIVHHDLIKALCIERNRKETSSPFSSKSHVLLRQCIQLYEQNGWDRNSTVPDDLPALRQPLLYLTCAFGKHRVLETLLKLNFNPSVVTEDGENGLHALVDHFYRVGNMKQCGGFMAIEKRLEVFENVVNILCVRDPQLFSVKEKKNGRTPLHIAAESVVYCTSRHARVDGRCDPLKRTRYFQRCLEVMLGHILQLKQNSLITLSQLTNTITAQDNNGNTILHILSRSPCFPAWESIQNVLKNFSNSELPSMKNKESKTAFEILSSVNADVARKLFFPSDHPAGGKDEESLKGIAYFQGFRKTS